MIRPQLTADGTAVRLADDRPDAMLDDLALAYAADPQTVGRLLTLHGANVEHADELRTSTTAPEYAQEMAAAEADGTRDALWGELTPPVALDHVITADEAVTLATRLMRRVARIRHTAQNGTTA